MKRILSGALGALLLVPTIAAAAEPPRETSVTIEPAAIQSRADSPEAEPPSRAKAETWDVWAWGRGRYTATSDYALDSLGTRKSPSSELETRLRFGGAWAIVTSKDWAFELNAELDAFSGLVGGTTPLGTVSYDQNLRFRRDERFGLGVVSPRQLYAALRTPIGLFRVGMQSFSWGTGMLANSGAGEPDFGDRRYGDVINRVAFATKPLSGTTLPSLWRETAVFVGGDYVERDENALRARGDRAFGAVIGVRAEHEGAGIGVVQSFRRQKDRADVYYPERERTEVKASATDVWARIPVLRSGGREFALEGEAALILGSTTRPYLQENRFGADVLAGGGVFRMLYRDAGARLSAKAEAGYASGDNDTHDDVVRTFTFDPDYKVGLLMFDEVLLRLSARGVDRVNDPALLGRPPAGARYLITQGSVTNAMYLNPVVRWSPVGPVELRLGWLLARSAADLVDPYSSATISGYNATYGGRPRGSRALGQEIDAAVKVKLPLPGPVRVRVGAEGGVMLPGAAFDGVDLGTPWLARGGLDVWF